MDSSIEKPLKSLIKDEDHAIITAKKKSKYLCTMCINIFKKQRTKRKKSIKIIIYLN
jgi:hypothetical protein